ncbi:MAG: isoprenylcysteine carboxylmethyltransferase family protein, partial [Deltaproteobacteria bacterium]|nr:isoprenylcysteine carboxylmethyltransferase family protein [Deltaproteobacteria bacterium]
FALAPAPRWSLVPMAMGATLLLLGIGFRLWAVRTLGAHYSHQVRLLEGHRLIESGPYRWLRHPAYAGMLLAHLGLLVCFPNLVALLSWAGLLLPAIAYRIGVEERVLRAIPGWEGYSRIRARLVPGLW